MTENQYETLLNINTCGIEDLDKATHHYNRYEPTSYLAIKELFNNYILYPNDILVDFGCGKGRLSFYIGYFYKIQTKGIEFNMQFYNDCISNLNNYNKKNKFFSDNILFLNCLAQDYNITNTDNKFYFFNPFSVQIFSKVIDNILQSYENYNRPIDIILYYPSNDYIYYINNYTYFELINEIRLDNLYEKDSRERFLIYRLDYLTPN